MHTDGTPTTATNLAERFWAKVKRPETGCWTWTGVKSNGYGRMKIRRRFYVAHRISYELNVGPIPAGLFVCHHCDNPPCVRPDHLFLGTNSDNQRDSVAKGRFPLGARHHNAKLDPGRVREIRRRAASREATATIARAVGISAGAVQAVLDGRTWRHVT